MTITESCWEQVPELPLDPSTIEGELTEEQVLNLARSFVLLAAYVETQRVRCGKQAEQ